MEPMSAELLQSIAQRREIEYEATPDDDPLIVRTRMSKVFPISQRAMFDSFSDPEAHVPLFQILVSATPPIRQGIQGLIPENTFFSFEHVQESNLPPRLMLTKYTLSPPSTITKEGVTDPFSNIGIDADRKKAMIQMHFDPEGPEATRLTTDSAFHAETGAIFSRGFIDRVWLNFFERMMFANGQISEAEYLT